MIGEIRDLETAEAAVQASLTGHLVFSTLHTNDAASATTRLLDMGIEPFLVASSVEAILAQRLVRRTCGSCMRRREMTAAELPEGLEPPADGMVVEAVGCRECRRTGFRGRVGAFELLRLTDSIRELIVNRADATRIRKASHAEGELDLLRDAAWDLVRAGVTTPAEAMRVIRI